jgi:hypothetical protein
MSRRSGKRYRIILRLDRSVSVPFGSLADFTPRVEQKEHPSCRSCTGAAVWYSAITPPQWQEPV